VRFVICSNQLKYGLFDVYLILLSSSSLIGYVVSRL
jgi:hypothetical protein